ncbi:CaiB/BaiF CoA transferase family protein [Piscinibacter koreensis]|uniref:CoA transferase n=1 Tax=Piscinibacter koreensis TaxID=2742824 RepID=A0A7Y6TWK0_9BURK|nr:CoA transferase [Schlegelella koreensis]NUZ06107.1 CoA transferase [Schlegelella koreensis]
MSDTSTARPRPLAGVRVLDFTIMMAGPYATRYLADLGAEVIKVEASEGDYIRSRAPLRDGHSAYFSHLNAGKQSIVLDLKNPVALQAVKALVAECDVVVENFRPGVMKRLGLDYETLAAINPRLVMCSISGFGQTGPAALRPAYAQIVQAGSGYELAFARYQGETAQPANTAIFIADVLGGTYAFAGILAALNQRHLTGRGQHVDTTLIEGMLNLMPYEVQEAQFPEPKRRPVYPPFPTRDGWLMVAAVSPRNFEGLLDAIGVDGWRADPTMMNDAARQKNWSAVMDRVRAWTAERDTAECERIIGGAGVPVTPYLTVREALDEAQLVHRESLARTRDGAGELLVPNLPFKLSDGEVRVGARTPELGADTDAVLARVLGWSEAQIAAVKAPAADA